jgi:hypothetical protein
MITFETEEEREDWLIADANRQIEWEKGLTYFNKETGKNEPTEQALHHRTFEEAYKIAEHSLWRQNIPEDVVKAKYAKIRGGTLFNERMNDDYSPQLRVRRSATETYITNAGVDKDGISILYSGKPTEISNELIDELFCTGDSSYNPLRPFRWYATPSFAAAICVMTTTEEEIHAGRMEAFNAWLEEIGNPDFITIFKV